MEGALLERAKPWGRRAGPLRRDDQGGAGSELVDGGRHRLLRLLPVGAVDEGDPGDAEELAEARDVGGLLLGHPGEAAAQELGHQDRVDLRLVVEGEDAWPRRPQVLGADHVHFDAGDGEAHVGAHAAGDVDERLARAP